MPRRRFICSYKMDSFISRIGNFNQNIFTPAPVDFNRFKFIHFGVEAYKITTQTIINVYSCTQNETKHSKWEYLLRI